MPTSLPDLAQTLYGRDLSFLKAVADLWDIPWNQPDARSGMPRLAAEMLDGARVTEVVEGMPASAKTALNELIKSEGRLPWSLFTRRYGSIREMGPGRRDRERPHRSPVSATESLWYHAFIGRSFFDTPDGLQEFAYIPADLLDLLPVIASDHTASFGRAASPAERSYLLPSNDSLLDDACTLLAALRLDFSETEIKNLASAWQKNSPYPPSPKELKILLSAASLLDAREMPQPEPVRLFLEAPRLQALAQLVSAWLHSQEFNDLRLVPELQAEGEWHNEPVRARQAILDFIVTLPEETWWSLSAFLAAVRLEQPDFQRPAGDYDSWFLREVQSGEFLRGFEHWDAVEGRLIRYILGGPLHWLGLVELASQSVEGPLTAFRITPQGRSLLRGEVPDVPLPEEEKLFIRSDARLTIPRRAPRAVRYQAARFSAWEGERSDGYHYRLTPASLQRAQGQGLRVSHLIGLLRRYADYVPPSLVKALDRWESQGSEVRVDQVTILRLSTPELMASLRSSKAGRFLAELVGPTAVIVKPGAWKKVLAVLAEMGYLGESSIAEDIQPSMKNKKSPE